MASGHGADERHFYFTTRYGEHIRTRRLYPEQAVQYKAVCIYVGLAALLVPLGVFTFWAIKRIVWEPLFYSLAALAPLAALFAGWMNTGTAALFAVFLAATALLSGSHFDYELSEIERGYAGLD
jgi:hypothetical protein